MFVVGSEVLFAGTDAGGHQNLLITDGTAGGTSELSVAEANSEGLFSNSTVPSFTLFGSEILFAGMDAARSSDVFANPGLFVATVTSGTVGGIWSCCRHSKPTHTASAPRTSRSSTAKCCFRDSTTTAATSSYGRPTAPLTELRRIATGGAGGLQPTQLTVLSGTVAFAGVDFTNKHGLWATNGALGGTSEILSTNAPGGGLNPTDLTVFGSKVLFAGKDNSANNNLWVTDGTSAGTSELTVSGVHSGGILLQRRPCHQSGLHGAARWRQSAVQRRRQRRQCRPLGDRRHHSRHLRAFHRSPGGNRSQPVQLLRIRQ